MKKIIYLAYGSNMNIGQMNKRCPQAKLLGSTEILGYSLLFRGKKRRAVATIEKKSGGVVPALLWEIGEREEVALNHYEGYPFLYEKERITVLFQGKAVKSMVYIMKEGVEENTPHPYYYKCIEESYKTEGFCLELLESTLKQSENALNQRETQGGVLIKKLDMTEMEQCIAIADQQLGAGYFTEQELSLVFRKKDQYFCDVAVDLRKNNQIIGFAYVKIIPARQFAQDLRLPLCGLPFYVRQEENVAIVKTVSVGAGYQGQGVGRRLVGEVTEKLLKKEKNVACVAWKKANTSLAEPDIVKNRGRTNIGTVLGQNGYEAKLERPDFWLQESLEKGCGCPHCGEICHCSAVIYFHEKKCSPQ